MQIVERNSLEESPLFRQITDTPLKAHVLEAAQSSADLLSTFPRDMPLFTLHDERHVLNIIGWMETLLQPAGIGAPGQLERALCIIAAYTHDLGMTLDAQERAVLLFNDPTFIRHRERFPEECRLIERLRAEGEHERANIRHNQEQKR